MDNKELVKNITECKNIEIAQKDKNHPCHNIVVNGQEGAINKGNFHVPEPYNGPIKEAKFLFISSNPSFWEMEHYPTLQCSRDMIFDFFEKRFDDGETVKEWKANHNKEGQKKESWSRYWTGINKYVHWIKKKDYDKSNPANLLQKVALTEIVHCKSHSEIGVKQCACVCAEKWLNEVLSQFKGKYVVIVGVKAKGYIEILAKKNKISLEKYKVAWVPHPNARGYKDEKRQEFLDEIRLDYSKQNKSKIMQSTQDALKE